MFLIARDDAIAAAPSGRISFLVLSGCYNNALVDRYGKPTITLGVTVCYVRSVHNRIPTGAGTRQSMGSIFNIGHPSPPQFLPKPSRSGLVPVNTHQTLRPLVELLSLVPFQSVRFALRPILSAERPSIHSKLKSSSTANSVLYVDRIPLSTAHVCFYFSLCGVLSQTNMYRKYHQSSLIARSLLEPRMPQI